jgi:hypothetical protein
VADRLRTVRRPAAQPDGPQSARRRIVVFVVVVALCLGGLAAYLVGQRHSNAVAAEAAAAQDAGRTRLPVADVLAVPHLMVRNTEPGPSFGTIALIPLDHPDGPRAVTDIPCERLFGTARGAICLQAVTGLVTTYRTVFLDAELSQTGTQELGGVPSRARMSADGSWAASTVFLTGHSYADQQFSTETVITDMATQASLGNLESWTTLRDGVPFAPQDRNYWGVSFIGDGPQFYATMGTGGKRHLVLGDATRRQMTVLDVEGACPSVSPGGQTAVFKQQDPQSKNDHFVAMPLPGGATVALPEGRLVDDQVAWLDEDTVLYAVGKGVSSSVDYDVWSAPVDGGAPALLVRDAASPSVVRPTGH